MKIKKLKTSTFIGFIIKPAPYINPGSKKCLQNVSNILAMSPTASECQEGPLI